MGTEAERWVRLHSHGELIGLGFHLSRTYLVTATHCIATLTLGDTLEASNQGGLIQSVTFVEAVGDVALLVSYSPQTNRVAPLRATVPTAGDRWIGEGRMTDGHAVLTGEIARANLPYELTYGQTLVHQLTTDEHIGDHHGYSGGPISTPRNTMEPSILGLLVEQYPDAVDRARSSNVLFAIPIHSILTCLSAFDPLYSSRAPDPQNPVAPTEVERPDNAHGEGISGALIEADQFLRQAKQWVQDDIIPAIEYEIIRVRVRKMLVKNLEKR